ncbi:TonB-dependent receptor plug domain-containing protein [Duganella violaceipulchra]|uniref:Iron complex outermembrane receptor protein n=1 Tax=Duganella violaceipulchra TaxID=2849652 RepID=A0AA41L4F6_9BURK|nr:TonB-dependent receptor [Duganella violaceicalia]MBV6322884.1 TonB-dependent receptor [Duganella violaceicalia]MCP2007966.1 iron complex outermembrane receptor protein [Duganella violaceicalia]
MKKPLFKKSAIAIALTVAFSQHAYAQQAADTEPKLQRVEITGSSIKRTDNEAAASVQVLTRDDIERTGKHTILDLLRSSSATSTNVSSATASSGSFATGASGIEMRNLGKVSTLILVNGRRIAPYGLADGAQENFTNLDAIPTDAVERIEILKDGASAIYGSDAIAGVINIILRKDYEGGKVTVNYETADGFQDNRNRSVSAIYGYGDIDKQGFNTYITFEGYKRDGYSIGDMRGKYPDWYRKTPGHSTWDAKNTYSPTGNYFYNSAKIVALPGCPADQIDPADKLCKFDLLPYTGLTTNNKRYAAMSNTHFKIGANIDANFEFTTAGATNEYIVPPLATFSTTSPNIWYNAIDGKMIGPFFYPKLPVGNNGNSTSQAIELRARLLDTGNGFNFNRTESDQSRAMLDLSGTVGDYDWKSAAGYMTSSASKATRATSMKGYNDAIVNNTYKFGQKNDTALLESMFPVRTTKGKSKIAFFDATVSGAVAQLPAGPLSVAVGTDLRRESYEMSSSDNVLRGDLVGIFGLQVKDTVSHYAVFTEATVPVVKKLELSAALRADKTSGTEAHVSPKVGLKFNATETLLLRGTASGGFRAPNIVEAGNGLGRSAVSSPINDLRRCPIATELNKLVQNGANATTTDKAQANTFLSNECKGSVPSFTKSNPDLKPETSRSYTLGLVFEPVKNWTLALDYYNIERKNEIGTRDIGDVLKGEATLPAGQLVRVDSTATDNEFLTLVKKYAPSNTVNFQGIGQLGLIYNPYVNSGKTKASGVDFDIAGRVKIPNVGDLRLKLEGNYALNYQVFAVADNAYGINSAGNYDAKARLNTKLRASLKVGAFDHGTTVNYSGGYGLNSDDSLNYCATSGVSAANMPACERVRSLTTVDYNLAYSGIKNVKLALYINNLLNKDAQVNYRATFTTPQFRTFAASASYTF